MWKFDAVRGALNVTTGAGTLWQFGFRPWAWRFGYWPRASQACFRFWLVGWLQVRRYYDVPWPDKGSHRASGPSNQRGR